MAQGYEDIAGDGGVLKRVVREGGGAKPVAGDELQVRYEGRLNDSNGTKFDSSQDKGRLYTFQLGAGQVIKAWDIGFGTMSTGEIALLICKPDYAYGARSLPSVPSNSTLHFEVELVSFKSNPASTAALDHALKHYSPVTTYFPIFYKDYAANYGENYFSAAVRSFHMVSNLSGVLCCQPIQYTVYKIEVIRGARTWIVKRRFRDFYALYKKSQYYYPIFPSKTYFPVSDLVALKERMLHLNAFLHSYLERESKNRTLQTNTIIVDFLELNRSKLVASKS